LAYPNALATYPANSQAVANFYYAAFGGDPAPLIQQTTYPANQTGTAGPGNPGMAWHDSVITKQRTNISWTLDGILIVTVDSTGATLSTNVFVNYYDTSSGLSPIAALSFGLIDNLRVETLSLPKPTITSIKIVGSNVQFDFTGIAADTAASFKIQSSALFAGTFADVSPVASISQLGSGSFRATTPVNGAVRFHRVSR
jgi:hypothetical protein